MIKQLILSFFIIITMTNISSSELEQAKINFWKNGFFHQETVDMSKCEAGIIRARIDGKWQEYVIRELPDVFMEWDIKKRIETIEKISKGKMPDLSGPHNGIVASYGIGRDDTKFIVNNAVKGMGFIPKKEKLDTIIEFLRSTYDSNFTKKLDVLTSLYKDADNIFDRTKQVSLELYATPEFNTQTFLNEMGNPAVAIVFLDIPSYKIKGISQLLHPDDPKLSEYEIKIIEYVNLIHSYFHGDFDKKFITTVYHIVEVYDNSPGKSGKGVRLIPSP